jgi:hypothetical protein
MLRFPGVQGTVGRAGAPTGVQSAPSEPDADRRPLIGLSTADAAAADNWQAIVDQLAAAKLGGYGLLWPNARIPYQKFFTIDSVVVEGSGPLSEAAGGNFADVDGGTWSSAIYLTGTAPGLLSLKLSRGATSRQDGYQRNGVTGAAATDVVVQGVTVENCTAASFLFDNVTGLTLEDCSAIGSWADSFHFTNGTNGVRAKRLFSSDCGDDVIATVSYETQGVYTHDIVVEDVRAIRGRGRLGAVVGGKNITYRRFVGEQISRFGLYVTSEAAYESLGVDGVLLDDIYIDQTGYGLADSYNWHGVRIETRRDRPIVVSGPLAGDDFWVRNVRLENVRIRRAGGYGSLINREQSQNITYDERCNFNVDGLNGRGANAGWTPQLFYRLWTPADSKGGAPLGWYDPMRRAAKTVTADAIAQIDDLSGRGNHLVQATDTKRPATATIAATLPPSFAYAEGHPSRSVNLPAMSFDVTNDQLVSTLTAAIPQPFAVFMLVRRNTASQPYGVLFDGSTNHTGSRPLLFLQSADFAAKAAMWAGGTAAAISGAQLTANTNYIIGAAFNGAVTARSFGRLNGVQTGLLDTGSAQANGFTIGGNSADANVQAESTICEIVVVTGNMETVYTNDELYAGEEPVAATEAQRIEGYLAHKWCQTALLPSDHPFKTFPPSLRPSSVPVDNPGSLVRGWAYNTWAGGSWGTAVWKRDAESPRTVQSHIDAAIADMTRGKSPGASSQALYSANNYNRTAPAVTRNASLFCPYDLTAMSVQSPDYAPNPPTGVLQNASPLHMISPIHAIAAAHYWPGVGETYVFQGADGTLHTRTVAARQNIAGTDIGVIALSNPLPIIGSARITPFKLLPADHWKWFYPGAEYSTDPEFNDGVPGFVQSLNPVALCLYRRRNDAEERLRIAPIRSTPFLPDLTPPQTWTYSRAIGSTYDGWAATLTGGDSGSGVFLPISGELVLATTVFTSASGPSPAAHTAAVLATMEALSPGYTNAWPKFIDLSGFLKLV